MQNPWHTNLKKTKENLWSRTLAYKTHVCIYDYLGGHKDFIRLIFVTAIEKLQILAFHQSFSIYILYIYTVYTVKKVICRSFFRVLNSKLEGDSNRWWTEQL